MALGPIDRACGSARATAVEIRPQTTRPGSENGRPGLMAPEVEAEAEGETANRIPSQGPSHKNTQDRGHAASWIRPEDGYRSDRMWGTNWTPGAARSSRPSGRSGGCAASPSAIEMTREVRDRHVVQVDEEVHLLGFGREAGLPRNAVSTSSVMSRWVTTSGSAARMVKRRVAAASLPSSTCCHTFRATGITAYLENGGTIENAQAIAAHESPRTTKLYDRTSDEITLDEVERIVI